jgi:hypothetical protein
MPAAMTQVTKHTGVNERMLRSAGSTVLVRRSSQECDVRTENEVKPSWERFQVIE